MLNNYLHKEVLMHSFLDQSGCVFLDLHSGETLSVLMSATEIVKVLTGNEVLDESDELQIVIISLIKKNILLPFDNKNTDV